jgi:hypothetical protein
LVHASGFYDKSLVTPEDVAEKHLSKMMVKPVGESDECNSGADDFSGDFPFVAQYCCSYNSSETVIISPSHTDLVDGGEPR